MNTFRLRPVIALAVLLSACGGDDDGGDDIDPNLCVEMTTPVGTIDAYPGAYTGATVGGGANLSAPEGACADETGGWFAPVGEDVVVSLTNLTPGQLYGVTLQSEEDVGYYVVTGCQVANAGPAPGECLAFNDATSAGESGAFTAPDTGSVWVVVDSANFEGMAPPTGAFTLNVVEAECVDNAGCAAPTPACVEFACVECASPFDCPSADEPVCAMGNTCEAGYTECTGDDASDDGAGGNDGPAAATVIDTPTEATETVVDAAVCSSPAGEEDWFAVEITDAGSYGFQVDWAGADNDLDVLLVDATNNLVGLGINEGAAGEAFLADLEPGTYYAFVYLYLPEDEAAAVPYTLTARVSQCAGTFDCADAAEPVCNAAGACNAGPAVCTGDDAADDAGGDDGPAGATDLSGPVGNDQVQAAAVCSAPADVEYDYYAVTVTDGQGILWELSFDDADGDLDLAIFDSEGRFMGASFWVQPEVVQLSYLPAGTYYAQVALFTDEEQVAAVAYSIAATTTAAQDCATVQDCAEEYTNQIFRGSCDTGGTGACSFFEGEGAVAAGDFCDSSDDCEVACSYLAYESDAHLSVCIDACTTTDDCAAQGEGLACTTGGSTNFCTPACSEDLECGGKTSSGALDVGEPWDYRTCDVDTGSCAL